MTLAIDGVGSHYPVLAAMVAATRGPVLELGMGDFSTPLLHMICGAVTPPRRLVSIDSDPAWVEKFKHLRNPSHVIACYKIDVSQGPATCFDRDKWAVAFVDFAPGEDRTKYIEHNREMVSFFVVHDAEDSPVANYRFAECFKTFKYVWKWGACNVDTAVLSDRYPIPLEGL
jgi:hypothetical protein